MLKREKQLFTLLIMFCYLLSSKIIFASEINEKPVGSSTESKITTDKKNDNTTIKRTLSWEMVFSNACDNKVSTMIYNFRGYGLNSYAPWVDIKQTNRSTNRERTDIGLALPLNEKRNFQFRFSYANDFDEVGKRMMPSRGYRLISFDYDKGYGVQLGREENEFDSINRGIGFVSFDKQKRLSIYGGFSYQKYNNSHHETVTLMYVSPRNLRVLAGPVSNTGEKTGFMGSVNIFSSKDYKPNLTFYSYYVDIPGTKTICSGLFALGKPGSPVSTYTTFSFPGAGVTNQVLYDELGVLKINPNTRAFSISSLNPDGTDWLEKWEYGGTVLSVKKFKTYGVRDFDETILYHTLDRKCRPHIGLGISRTYQSGKETYSTILEAGIVSGAVKLRIVHNNNNNGYDSTFLETRIKF